VGLPDLYYPPPGEAGWREYWFNHWIDHQDIVQAIQEATGVQLQMYIIDPWVNSDKDGILERHQQYHDDMDAVLGIAGNDLSEIDFQKPNEVKSWVYLNYQEHLSAHSALNI
jgi:hypothetical protein